MKKMNRIFSVTLILVIIASSRLLGQQDAMNSQYVMNKLFINPAYAGYKEQPTFVAMHRSQWVGFKGAPTTQVLSFDTPMKKQEFAMGGTLYHDKTGPVSRLAITGDFSYRMRMSNRATMCFGMKFTGEVYQANLTDLSLNSDYTNQVDEAFMYNTKGLVLPNVGFGMYYHQKGHYIGISIPKLLSNKLEKKGTNAYQVLDGRQAPTLIITAGKVWKVNRQVRVQPNLVIRAVQNAPVSAGLYFNVIIFDQFTVGAYSYVTENAGLLFQWQLNKQFRMGYGFDVATSNLITTNLGSHELSASFMLPTKKKRIIYPRYF